MRLSRSLPPILRLSGALVAVTALALAACGGPRYGSPRADALTPLREAFDAADRDGDENLTREEMAAGLPKLAPAFDAIDTDSNQRISTGELRSYLEWQRVLRAPPAGSRDPRL